MEVEVVNPWVDGKIQKGYPRAGHGEGLWVDEELGKKSSWFAYVFQALISALGSPRTIPLAKSSLAPNTSVSGQQTPAL